MIDRRTVLIGAATLAAVRPAQSVTPDPGVPPKTLPTERVLGIGGLFFRSQDPEKLAQWYQFNLGIDPMTTTLRDPTGRPQFLVDVRDPIKELV